jgi:hypothetical protein
MLFVVIIAKRSVYARVPIDFRSAASRVLPSFSRQLPAISRRQLRQGDAILRQTSVFISMQHALRSATRAKFTLLACSDSVRSVDPLYYIQPHTGKARLRTSVVCLTFSRSAHIVFQKAGSSSATAATYCNAMRHMSHLDVHVRV